MPFGLPGGGIIEPAFNVGYSSEMTIEELTPGTGSGKGLRKVVLRGPSLPFMGATWASTLQVVTTWYPGNGTEATQQVLGPRESPSSWEGEWNRTRMSRCPTTFVDEDGTSSQVIHPAVLRDVVESIMRGGALLRVTWQVKGLEQVGGSEGGKQVRPIDSKIVREGRMKSVSFPHDRHTDIRWNIEFDWKGRGGTQVRVANVDQSNDLATAANSTIAAAAEVSRRVSLFKRLNAVNGLRRAATRFTLGQLETIAAAPTALVDGLARDLTANINNVKRVGDIAATLASQPTAVANSLVDFSRNTVAIVNRFKQSLGTIPVEKQADKSKVSDLARTTTYLGGIDDDATDLARQAQALDNSLRKTVVSGANRGAITVRDASGTRAQDLIQIYIAKSGDSPTTVSQRFYKNPDHGVDILRANRMPWYTPAFRAGQVIVIPVLSSAARNV